MLLFSDDLDATVAAVEAAGGTVTEAPTIPGRTRFVFADPRQLLGVWASSSGPATPRASRPRRSRAGRALQAAGAPRRRSTSYDDSAPPSSTRARSTIAHACRPRAARSTQRGGVPSGASRVGRWCRFISASAASGRHRATSRSARSPAAPSSGSRSVRSASPTSGSCAARRLAGPATARSRPAPRAPAPRSPDHDGLARLERRVVEVARPAQAERVALDGQRQPGVRRPGAPRARRAGRAPSRPPAGGCRRRARRARGRSARARAARR